MPYFPLRRWRQTLTEVKRNLPGFDIVETGQLILIGAGSVARSQNYDGTTGWAVFGDGSAKFFGAVTIGGTLTVDAGSIVLNGVGAFATGNVGEKRLIIESTDVGSGKNTITWLTAANADEAFIGTDGKTLQYWTDDAHYFEGGEVRIGSSTAQQDLTIASSDGDWLVLAQKGGDANTYEFFWRGGPDDGSRKTLAIFGNTNDLLDVTIDGTLDVGEGLVADAFTAPTLLNSWVNHSATFNNAGYRKLPDGRVEIRGMIKSGTTTSSTPVFVLPVGYRPTKQILQGIYGAAGAARIDITTGGSVQTNTNWSSSYMSIDMVFSLE